MEIGTGGTTRSGLAKKRSAAALVGATTSAGLSAESRR